MFRRRSVSFILCLLLSSITTLSLAQSNSGSLRGQVRDTTGAAVPGATIKIIDLGTNATVTVTSGSDGQYSAPSLRPVNYSIRIEPGHRARTRQRHRHGDRDQ
jgi:protocatechuate 3,4-dioxygenase beta subunit